MAFHYVFHYLRPWSAAASMIGGFHDFHDIVASLPLGAFSDLAAPVLEIIGRSKQVAEVVTRDDRGGAC